MERAVRFISGAGIAYCQRISQAWNEFWFTPRDPFALCVMRCLVGWMSFYTVFVWGLELESFIFPHGYNSAELIQDYFQNVEGPYALSFWFWVPEAWIYPLHYVCLAVTFCFMIGLFTRVTSVMSLVILISYAYRARFSNYGLDQINIVLVLYLCLAPCATYLSVDSLMRRYRTLRGKIQQNLPARLDAVRADVATNVATRLIQFHYCVIYFSAGTGKMLGETWWDGTAMWRSLANAEYQTFDMTWMAYFPWATEFLTHLTIFWELSFCFLIWRPLTRPVVMLLGLGMHFGIGFFMGMWTFATCMMFGYLAFMNPQMVKAFLVYLASNWLQKERKTVTVDRHVPASVNSAAWQKAWDMTNHLEVQTGEFTSDSEMAVPETQSPVLLFDAHAESSQKIQKSLHQQGWTTTQVSRWSELPEHLEQTPQAAGIFNLQSLSDLEVQEYLHSYLPGPLKNRPSVTLLRNEQGRQLSEVVIEEYQRIMLFPCSLQEINQELQKAEELFAARKPRHSDESPGSYVSSYSLEKT